MTDQEKIEKLISALENCWHIATYNKPTKDIITIVNDTLQEVEIEND